MVSTIYKTISNINIVLSNFLQMRYIFAIFSPWMMLLVGKVTISASLKKIHFGKISDQAPLIIYWTDGLFITMLIRNGISWRFPCTRQIELNDRTCFFFLQSVFYKHSPLVHRKPFVPCAGVLSTVDGYWFPWWPTSGTILLVLCQ